MIALVDKTNNIKTIHLWFLLVLVSYVSLTYAHPIDVLVDKTLKRGFPKMGISSKISSSQPDKEYPKPYPEGPIYWRGIAMLDLLDAKESQRQPLLHQAKNTILFLGDGFGITTVTAGRIMKGQLNGYSGEETVLAFEKFSDTGLLKTYNTDMQTPDSAATATALLSGVKSVSLTIGVNENVKFKNCSSYSPEAHNVYSFIHHARKAGKSVGIVTTTTVTHATPAAAYGHSVHRLWEDDTDRNNISPDADPLNCPDMATQLIENGIDINVVLGGGRLKFLPSNVSTRDSYSGDAQNGTRSDGINLIQRWKNLQSEKKRKFRYVETLQELSETSVENTDYLLGLFGTDHMMFDVVNKHRNPVIKEPSLSEMTEKALKILQKNENGFALLVEGGRIDHGHHLNMAGLALHEVVEFEATIDSAVQATPKDETLTIVTADHSHVFSLGGWGRRGNPILGKSLYTHFNRYNSKHEALAEDNLPYTVLMYGDGPFAEINRPRKNLTDVNTSSVDFQFQALVNMPVESHGGDDIPVYAQGPGSYLFHRTHEQSYVAHVVMHSMCIGEYATMNDCLPEKKSSYHISASTMTQLLPAAATLFMCRMFFSTH